MHTSNNTPRTHAAPAGPGSKRLKTALFLAALGLAGAQNAALATTAPQSAEHAGATPVVQTANGQVQGLVQDNVQQFLGIPFAAPPVGDLRWRPPQAAASWKGVRKTTEFGSECPQPKTFPPFSTPSTNEDCLYLNVYAPAQKSDKPLPVMVWLYGGRFVIGAADTFIPNELVKRGDVIVVTVNYRLGYFGFFALPSLDAEDHEKANYGLMDQQQSLRWVQKNIAAFGGDASNVTLFGSSVGGQSALANMVSPQAKGLFHKAILHSPSRGPRLQFDQADLATAQARGEELARQAGCDDLQVACLRALSAEQLLEKVNPYPYNPQIVVDGKVVPTTLRDALDKGTFHPVPSIVGSNRDEWRLLSGIGEFMSGKSSTPEQYPELLDKNFGSNARTVQVHYPLAQYGSTAVAEAAATTDWGVSCPTRQLNVALSHYVPVYAYEFADRTAPAFYPPNAPFPPASFPYGAFHTAELQYLFRGSETMPGTSNSLNPQQEKLSDQMIAYWTNFAATGNPNSAETVEWPAYTAENETNQIMQLPKPYSEPVAVYLERHKCALWENLEKPLAKH